MVNVYQLTVTLISALDARVTATVMLMNIMIPDINNEDIVPTEAHGIYTLPQPVTNPFLQATLGTPLETQMSVLSDSSDRHPYLEYRSTSQ